MRLSLRTVAQRVGVARIEPATGANIVRPASRDFQVAPVPRRTIAGTHRPDERNDA